MITNKKHKSIINELISEYEGQIHLRDRMIEKVCIRLSKDVFCEELGRYRTPEEWEEALLRECQ